jgi:phenylpropionate dioxygenase-like ring-hydroxylating dioxygenase large terminal subunit
MATFVKAAVEAKAHSLLGRFYTSPEIFKHERERIFACRWVCVGRD